MAKVTAQLVGFEQTRRALAAVPDRVRLLSADAVAASTFSLAQTARAMAPRDTGALRQAIVSKSTGLNGRVGLSPDVINGRHPQVYWRFVEFGTVRVPARPFFRPAAEREREAFIKRMRNIGPALERDLSAGRLL